MTRDDRETLRASVSWLRTQYVELPVAQLRALLDEADRLESERDELLLEYLAEDGT